MLFKPAVRLKKKKKKKKLSTDSSQLTSTSLTTLGWSSFFRMAISLYTFSSGNTALRSGSCCGFDPWGGRRPENKKLVTTSSTTEMTKTHQTFKQYVYVFWFFSLTQKSTLPNQLLLRNNFHCLNKEIKQMMVMTTWHVNTWTVNAQASTYIVLFRIFIIS